MTGSPDWTFYLVRYQVRTARGAKEPWMWTDTGNLTEKDARKFYNDMASNPHKNMRYPQLVRREEFVIEEGVYP